MNERIILTDDNLNDEAISRATSFKDLQKQILFLHRSRSVKRGLAYRAAQIKAKESNNE